MSPNSARGEKKCYPCYGMRKLQLWRLIDLSDGLLFHMNDKCQGTI